MSESPALEIDGLSKRFGPRHALRDVSLVVARGCVHGLLGANGAGKTTLMRIVLGLVEHDAGVVRCLGRERPAPGGAVATDVAGCVESPAFYPYFTGRQNLELLARLDDTSRGATRARAFQALERVGLDSDADAHVAGYSAGMRQRLALAAVLIRMPRLLVLDEPTNAVDPAGARRIRRLMQELADEGVAVVVSSHDMSEVEELCRSVTILDRGTLVFSDRVDELRARTPALVHALRTSDDRTAFAMASRHPGVRSRLADHGGLDVAAGREALDDYIVALGRAGIAVRALDSHAPSLESLFLDLTGRAVA